MIGNRIGGSGTRVLCFCNWFKGVFDQGFNRVCVKVSYCNDRHEVGAIPVAIKTREGFVLKCVEQCFFADGQSFGITRVFEQDRQLFVAHARSGTASRAPFFNDYTSFFFDFFGIKFYLVRPVAQNAKCLFHYFGAVCGHAKHIYGFVKARIGI